MPKDLMVFIFQFLQEEDLMKLEVCSRTILQAARTPAVIVRSSLVIETEFEATKLTKFRYSRCSSMKLRSLYWDEDQPDAHFDSSFGFQDFDQLKTVEVNMGAFIDTQFNTVCTCEFILSLLDHVIRSGQKKTLIIKARDYSHVDYDDYDVMRSEWVDYNFGDELWKRIKHVLNNVDTLVLDANGAIETLIDGVLKVNADVESLPIGKLILRMEQDAHFDFDMESFGMAKFVQLAQKAKRCLLKVVLNFAKPGLYVCRSPMNGAETPTLLTEVKEFVVDCVREEYAKHVQNFCIIIKIRAFDAIDADVNILDFEQIFDFYLKLFVGMNGSEWRSVSIRYEYVFSIHCDKDMVKFGRIWEKARKLLHAYIAKHKFTHPNIVIEHGFAGRDRDRDYCLAIAYHITCTFQQKNDAATEC
eukprot:CAMPEP_0202713188 /NCGR_PEP_ID=MMETSP1385-20130828/51316_1 /ASSEMBLY_ACC=CAM_ASM_000861 /TAXON_ID=933848 /ORGANISM="Elphidium margaritaceum" /LENGTH=415 /DNA_ID=CAMNT_0049373463 /DNA_START=174 /DNA_END=1421 /DNA_ORIENTATION=-